MHLKSYNEKDLPLKDLKGVGTSIMERRETRYLCCFSGSISKRDKTCSDTPVIEAGRLDAPILANAVIGNVDAGLVVVGQGMLQYPHWVETRVKLKKAVVPKKIFSRYLIKFAL